MTSQQIITTACPTPSADRPATALLHKRCWQASVVQKIPFIKLLTAILFFMIPFASIIAQKSSLQYSKVRINNTGREDIRQLQQMGLLLDGYHENEEYIEVVLSNKQIEVLNASRKSYQILIDDIIEHYNKSIKTTYNEMISLQEEMREKHHIQNFEFGSMGGFYTNDEVRMELDSMRLLYPDLITVKQSFGLSNDSLDIWMVKISDNPDIDEDEPEILYTALTHGGEPLGMATVMYFMYYLLEYYGTDPFVTFLIDNRELCFVPVVNPDGYVYNEQIHPEGGGMWRKNKSDNNENQIFDPDFDGVDLNRNFGYNWGYDDMGSSPDPGNRRYRGPVPFSEPETQAIRDLCLKHEFRLAFNYHSYGSWLSLPWGYILYDITPDSTIFLDLARNMTQYNNYTHSSFTKDFVLLNGGANDWMYGEQTEKGKIFAMTPEVGSEGNWPPLSRIYPLAEENIYPNLVLALGPGVLDTDTTLKVQYAAITTGNPNQSFDTVQIRAHIINHDSLPVLVQAFIFSLDKSIVDTVYLLDDGSHDDDYKNDGIYGGTYLAPSDDKLYSAHVLVSSDSGDTHFLNNIAFFTRVGPVIIDSFILTGNDRIPNPGDIIYGKISLRNDGITDTANNIKAKLISLDKHITASSSRLVFGNIPASESKTSSTNFSARISENCPANTVLAVLVEISSNDYVFWQDTFSILVQVPVDIEDNSEPVTRIYPNPVENIFTIEISNAGKQGIEIEILTIGGKSVYRKDHKSCHSQFVHNINLSGNAKGIYLVKITQADSVYVRKIIVK